MSTPLPEARTEPKRGLFARFIEAMMAARLRQAMREIEHHRHLVPENVLKNAGYEPTLTKDGAMPFTR
jgi:hypothetical protein